MTPLDLDAGRYAAFVWPCYAAAAALLIALTLDTLARARRWRREAERRESERRR